MKQLRSAFEELQLAIADTGLLKFVTDVTVKLTNFVRELSTANPEMFKWSVIAAAAAASLGPLIWGIGLVTSGIAIVGGSIATAGAAIVGFVGGPILIATAAVAALALAWSQWGEDLMAQFPEVIALCRESFGAISDVIKIFWEIAEPILSGIATIIGTEMGIDLAEGSTAWTDFAAIATTAIRWARDGLEGFAKSTRSTIAAIRPWLRPVVKAIPDMVTKMVDTIKYQLVDRFLAIGASMGDTALKVQGFFKDLWDKVTRHSYVPDMIDDIGDEFGRLKRDMISPAAMATGKVSDLFRSMRTNIRSVLDQVSNDLMSSAMGKFSGFLTSAITGLFTGGGRGGGEATGLDMNLNGMIGHASGAVLSGPTMIRPGHVGGESGPEALLPLEEIGGVLGVHGTVGDVNVTVIDQRAAGAPVEVKETETAGGGKQVMIFIRDLVRKGIRAGDFDAEMRVFGLERKGIRR
jgi:hypothetical protein